MSRRNLDEHPMVVAQRICATLGNAGRLLWLNSKTVEDPRERYDYLLRAIRSIRGHAASGIPYRELPVDVRTFVESEEMLDARHELYPKVMDELERMATGSYVEAVLTGGIGTGKTTLALFGMAYDLYLLSMMESPQAAFGLARSSEIIFIFQSLKKELAKSVDYERFKAMIDHSHYFQTAFKYDKQITSEMKFPHRITLKPLTGESTAAIGQNVFGGIIDEVNFMQVTEGSKMAHDGGTYDQAREIYNSIARRRQSRFMKQGDLPGMLYLVSSKQYPGEFTERKIEQAERELAGKGRTSVFVYDKRVWDVKPEGSFSGDWFDVFLGDPSRRPRILEAGEKARMPEEDQALCMAVPEEYREAFQDDLLAAIRDIGGVSTQAKHPFMMNSNAVSACFGKVASVLSRTDCDFDQTMVQVYPKRIERPNEPRFAHIDLGISQDSLGLAVGHVVAFDDIRRGKEVETLPVIQFDCILEIRPPRGGEIEFANARKVLYKLRDLGMVIRWLTLDSFQSKDTTQIMMNQGFISGLQSIDTDTLPYDITKQAFYDGRILAPEHPLCQQELIRLERDPATGKIDHPANGSKDCADSVAGVVFGLTMRRDIWVRHRIPLTRIPRSIIETVEASEVAKKNSVGYIEKMRESRYDR